MIRGGNSAPVRSACGKRDEGLGIGVEDLGFRVQGLGFRV